MSNKINELHNIRILNKEDMKYTTKIKFRLPKPLDKWVETTYGRLCIWEITEGYLPLVALSKKETKKMIIWINNNHPSHIAIKILKRVQDFSFESVTSGAISLCYGDLKPIGDYTDRFKAADEEASQLDGLERAEVWDNIINEITEEWFDTVDRDNPLFHMAQSGARVTDVQVRQMVVAKGLLTNMDGSLNPNAVVSSLSSGLPVHDYFRTCGPARRGLANNFFVVPASGYFARQLVSAARDLVISEPSCGTTRGVPIPTRESYGRYTLDGKFIYENTIEDYLKDGIDEVSVLSPITCESVKEGVCSKCCGLDHGQGVNWRVGVGIGVLAAQHLSEPSTQLGLRGKHCKMKHDTFLDVNGREIQYGTAKKAVDAGHSIYVHSCSPTGKIQVGKVKKVWQERWDNKYVKVTLDNGKVSKTTLDDPFMMRDGTYKRADELKQGDSLMPYYSKVVNEYREVKHNDTNTWESGYHLSTYHNDCDDIYDKNSSDQLHRHHKDFSKTNDYPNNILICSRGDHISLHGKKYSQDLALGLHDSTKKKIANHNREYWRRDLTSKTISNWISNNPEQHLEHCRRGLNSQARLLKDNPKWKYNASNKTNRSKATLAITSQLEANILDVLHTSGTGHWSVAECFKKYPEIVPECGWYSSISSEYFLSKQELQILTIYRKVISYLSSNNLPITVRSFNNANYKLYPKDKVRKNIIAQLYPLSQLIDINVFSTGLYCELSLSYFWTRNEKQAYSRYIKVRDELAKLGYTLTEDNYNTVSSYLYPGRCSFKYYDSIVDALPSNYNELDIKGDKLNHKVVSVELIEVDRKIPFYDIEIDSEWHNYPTSSGVFVHNTSGSVKLSEVDSSVENVLGMVIKALGGRATAFMPIGELSVVTLFDLIEENGDPIMSAGLLSTYVQDLFKSAGVSVNHLYLEVILRGCTDQVTLDNGYHGLRSYGDVGEIIPLSVSNVPTKHPSWLGSMSFGYLKSRLERSITEGRASYGTPVERVITTRLIK